MKTVDQANGDERLTGSLAQTPSWGKRNSPPPNPPPSFSVGGSGDHPMSGGPAADRLAFQTNVTEPNLLTEIEPALTVVSFIWPIVGLFRGLV